MLVALSFCGGLAFSRFLNILTVLTSFTPKDSFLQHVAVRPELFTLVHMDEPLVLKLSLGQYNTTTSVIIASAISQEGKVALVVLEGKGIKIPGYESEHQALPTLPPGLACSFTAHGGSTDDGNATVTSEIQPYARTQHLYNTSNIWMCDMPEIMRNSTHVSIVLPEWAERVMGSGGTFNLNKEKSHQMGFLNSCLKHVYGINNFKIQEVNEYLDYYSKLGVEHFTMYAELDRGENISALADSLKSRSVGGKIALRVFSATTRKAYRTLGWGEPKNFLQDQTVNDCLWRAKAANTSWTMMQFDFDELLVGTDYLPTYLSNASFPGLRIEHFLVKFPHDLPRLHRNKVLNISSHPVPTWGKSIYRTSQVDVGWVHHPTAPKIHVKGSKDLKLLHFRNATELFRRNSNWTEFVMPEDCC